MLNRDPVITNPFLIGTWTHGVPQFTHLPQNQAGDEARDGHEEQRRHDRAGQQRRSDGYRNAEADTRNSIGMRFSEDLKGSICIRLGCRRLCIIA